jgi:mannose-6-phosphate isomerase
MGAHGNGSAEVLVNKDVAGMLNNIIQQNPRETLGPDVFKRFGGLPYLFKILDVRDMLSIQVHPSKEMAELEFAEENRKGIPLDAAERNYKDENHKPELMVALSEFWLLHGFRPPSAIGEVLTETPELSFLLPVFEQEGYKSLYHAVMTMDQLRVNEVLTPLLRRIRSESGSMPDKESPDFWALRASGSFGRGNDIDRGIFSIYLFNMVHLKAGEGIFQDAGVPHAYLEGQNMELMANSDNVLRGGLTTKHVDVPELMKHVHFQETIPDILREQTTARKVGVFRTPTPDFELARVDLGKGDRVRLSSASTEISIVLEGAVSVRENPNNILECSKGEAWINFYGAEVDIMAEGESVIFRATVPASTTGTYFD